MNIGENIKAARKSKGITQKELAEKIGKSFSVVQKYELGLTVPPLDVIELISSVLEVSVESLVSEKELDTIKEFEEMGVSEVRRQRKEKLLSSWDKLNDEGQSIAVQQIEILTKSPHISNDGKK